MPPDDAPHIDPRPTAYPDPQTAGTPPQPIPQPMPPPVAQQPGPLARYWKYAAAAVAVVGWALAAWQALRTGEPIPPPPDLPEFARGWVDDPAARAASFARLPPVEFNTTPAGRVALGDTPDAFLWRAVRKAAGKGETDNWYPNVNQRDVGCCVGCGWKHGADVCAAVQVVAGRAEEWRPTSVEVIYGGSRVEVGGGQIRGDGSVGAWAREWVRSRGVAEMKKYTAADLTEFSPARARVFGRDGVPDEIEQEASGHPIKGTALVSSWADVERSLGQGYPVAVCSNVGFDDPSGSPGTRDRDGFCAARGTWPHCMVLIGVRGGRRPGAFCLNSWGDTAHRGPVWPADAPPAGFWIDSATVDRMVRQGDSYALADLQGFPSRRLDWFTRKAPDLRSNTLFALARPFALEVRP